MRHHLDPPVGRVSRQASGVYARDRCRARRQHLGWGCPQSEAAAHQVLPAYTHPSKSRSARLGTSRGLPIRWRALARGQLLAARKNTWARDLYSGGFASWEFPAVEHRVIRPNKGVKTTLADADRLLDDHLQVVHVPILVGEGVWPDGRRGSALVQGTAFISTVLPSLCGPEHRPVSTDRHIGRHGGVPSRHRSA